MSMKLKRTCHTSSTGRGRGCLACWTWCIAHRMGRGCGCPPSREGAVVVVSFQYLLQFVKGDCHLRQCHGFDRFLCGSRQVSPLLAVHRIIPAFVILTQERALTTRLTPAITAHLSPPRFQGSLALGCERPGNATLSLPRTAGTYDCTTGNTSSSASRRASAKRRASVSPSSPCPATTISPS